MPGGGISLDGPRGARCKPGFLLPVRVLSRLFRRLFLAALADAHAAGRLRFFGENDDLCRREAFARHLAPLKKRTLLSKTAPVTCPFSPSLSPKSPLLSAPYGCLLPRDIDGLLVAGRYISCDPSSHSFLREIPQCWLTGQAAGVAAAVAVAHGCATRQVPIAELQAALRRQQVLLRTEVEPALARAGETAEAKA